MYSVSGMAEGAGGGEGAGGDEGAGGGIGALPPVNECEGCE
jgi:hypothetical protein